MFDNFRDEVTGGLPPLEPSSDARTAALSLRGFFVALRETGFNEDQSLLLVIRVLEAQK